MDKKIEKYIKAHHLLTLAVCGKGEPYCANCFYAFNIENRSLIFASDIKTKHMKEAISNPKIAGTVSKETKNIGKIQGIQFTGRLKNSLTLEEIRSYFEKFPFAKSHKPLLWSIELDFVKLTDNLLGFGKKIVWQRV